MKYNTRDARSVTRMPSRYLESTVLYFFEKERDREVYYSICERERENLKASHIHVSQNTRTDADLYCKMDGIGKI